MVKVFRGNGLLAGRFSSQRECLRVRILAFFQEGYAPPLAGRACLVTGGSIHEMVIRRRLTGLAVGVRRAPCGRLAVQRSGRRQFLHQGRSRPSVSPGRTLVSVLAIGSALRRTGADRVSLLAVAARSAGDDDRRTRVSAGRSLRCCAARCRARGCARACGCCPASGLDHTSPSTSGTTDPTATFTDLDAAIATAPLFTANKLLSCRFSSTSAKLLVRSIK